MKWWSFLKTWVQPVIALAVVLYVAFRGPGWTPAGAFERVFSKVLSDKEAGSVNSAFYSMMATYCLMSLFLASESLYSFFTGRWHRAIISATVVTRNGKQPNMYVAVSETLGADIDIQVAFKKNDQAVYDRLYSRFPDLTLEVFWNPQDLSITANGLGTAVLTDDGSSAQVTLPVFPRFTCAGGKLSLGVVVQSADPVISSSRITPRLISKKHPVKLGLAVWSGWISTNMVALSVNVQK